MSTEEAEEADDKEEVEVVFLAGLLRRDFAASFAACILSDVIDDVMGTCVN